MFRKFVSLTVLVLVLTSVLISCSTIDFVSSGDDADSNVKYPFVYVYPSFVEADVNDTFTIAVVVENLNGSLEVNDPYSASKIPCGNLYGFEIQLGWDPSVIRYVNHTVTVPYEDYDSPIPPRNYTGVLHEPVIQITDQVDETASMPGSAPGTMYWVVYSSMNPAPPYNGNGTFFTMTFRVVKRGESPIRLTYVDLGDEDGVPIGRSLTGPWLKEPEDGVFRSSGVPICNITYTPKIGVVNKTCLLYTSPSPRD